MSTTTQPTHGNSLNTPSTSAKNANPESATAANNAAGAKKLSLWERVYNGEADFGIVPNRRRWFAVMAVMFLLSLAAILGRGFSLGIDFEGGTRMVMPPTATASESAVAKTFEKATGISPQSTQLVGSGNAQSIEINSQRLSEEQIRNARTALFEEFKPVDSSGEVSQGVISDSTVSESWGSSITRSMLIALGAFLLIVFAYIAIRLERDMAFAAIVCLIMDLVVVAGIYAAIGFEVSPATVIGLLTILAYSLYDTVVVFDKVHENTAGLFSSRRATYEEQVNLSVNQTIMRSINTSIFSLVPIASLLVVAVGILGVGTLKDLALVQFFGVLAGTFSSIFFAAPLLTSVKMREKKYREHTDKVLHAREYESQAPAASRSQAVSSSPAALSSDTARDSVSSDTASSDSAQTNTAQTAGTQSTVTTQDARTQTTTAQTTTAQDANDTDAQDSQAPRTVTMPTLPHTKGDAGQSWRPGM